MTMATIHTPLCNLLGIKHPIMLAGMNSVSASELVAAVSCAGGIGCIGGLMYTPNVLRTEIREMKEEFMKVAGKVLPFGVDLAIPQIGGSARKTNYDYTRGNLPTLIDIICEEKATLFVCAIGVPPKWAVDKLHDNGIIVMNMVGMPHHVDKALAAGADLICAQGCDAGGHTSDVCTMPLIPQCVDRCKGKESKFGPVMVVGAGGIYDGRGMAAALSLGAQGVWVGTRFVASDEAAAPKSHKNLIVKSESIDTIRSLAMTGRPLRVLKVKYVREWEQQPEKLKAFLDEGKVPLKDVLQSGSPEKKKEGLEAINSIAGQAVGGIHEILPAKEIVDSMIKMCVEVLQQKASMIVAKL